MNSTTRQRLHRCVFETVNGKIPDGFQVHHKDRDKGNNEPDNLELLSAEDHRKRHGDEMPKDLRNLHRQIMLNRVIPSASEWHGSPEGIAWHKAHYDSMKEKLRRKTVQICEQCGKEYETEACGHNRFCSNACKSAWRRANGVDDVERRCLVCGKTFTVNKYKKTKCCSRACTMLMGKTEA